MSDLFYHFGTALAIGLLIGMERQFSESDKSNQFLFGGVRTFPLLALTGCGAAMLADLSNSAIALAIPMLIAGALIVVAYKSSTKNASIGMTTEVAAVFTMVIGALCYFGQTEIAAALAIVVIGLLSLKTELHKLSNKLTQNEILSVAKFGLMSAIVLPVLPSEPTLPEPFDVLILQDIWLMVVLVTAISMVGYFLKKLLGSSKAIVLTGFLGGLISSTAVTLTFSASSKDKPKLAKTFAIAILVAWITMFLRVVVEVMVVNPTLVEKLWIPMFAAACAGGFYCWYLKKSNKSTEVIKEDISTESPFSIKKSLVFGGLYAAVLVVAKVAQIHFGDDGIYISAVAAGFTDVDAITLSMAKMSQVGGSVETDVAITAITLAAVSNTLVKASIVLATAHKALKKEILPGVILVVLAALAAVYFIQ